MIMKKITKTLAELATGYLQSDEELFVGLRVNLKGTALGIGFAGGIAGVVGALAGSKVMKEGQDQARDVGIPFTQQMALGLTKSRILIWERSIVSGKPTKLIGHILLDEIKKVDFNTGFLGDKISLIFSEDKILELESIKVDKGIEFAEKLKGLINNL